MACLLVKQEAQLILRECDMQAVDGCAEVQNATFPTTALVLLSRIRDHRILRSGSASACR